MELTPVYVEPINRYFNKVDSSLYREACALYEEGKHEEAFRVFMRYLNREMAESCEMEPGLWRIPHGSIVVDISIRDGVLDVTAPFVKLPSERLAPVLRQVFDINTRVLTLPRITLQDDALTFHYSCPLSLAEPFKTYGVLREICINGDAYDDEFIDEFGAVALREKEVTDLPAETVEQAWQRYHELLDEVLTYDEYYDNKRWYGFSYDIMGIGLMRIDYTLAPQGFLRTRLERAISTLWDKRPLEEVVVTLREKIRAFKTIPRETFDKDFYRSTFFMNDRCSGEVEAARKALGNRHEWATQDRSGRNATGVVMNYVFGAYDLLYKYFLPESLEEELVTTLTACSRRPWPEAADLAWASFQKIMDPAFQ